MTLCKQAKDNKRQDPCRNALAGICCLESWFCPFPFYISKATMKHAPMTMQQNTIRHIVK